MPGVLSLHHVNLDRLVLGDVEVLLLRQRLVELGLPAPLKVDCSLVHDSFE